VAFLLRRAQPPRRAHGPSRRLRQGEHEDHDARGRRQSADKSVDGTAVFGDDKVVQVLSSAEATVKVLVIDALWYIAAGSELVRLVLVRDFPGHERDDVFVSTDPTMSAKDIVQTFCLRWSLEVTFHDAKGKLGLEEPQSRTELAVERTAPMALWLYSLVVLWYLNTGRRLRAARLQPPPWYRDKTTPAFSDMLATLRRASWSERLFDPHGNDSTIRKRFRPLLDYLSAAA
jgi:hypothetical protein